MWKWIDFYEGTDSQFLGFNNLGLVGNLQSIVRSFWSTLYVIVKNDNSFIKTRDFRIQRNSGVPKSYGLWRVMIRFIVHVKWQLPAIIIVIVIAVLLIWQ